MSENNPRVPNTPQELIDMQGPIPLEEVDEIDNGHPDAFAEFLLGEILHEYDPSPFQVVRACIAFLRRLEVQHFHMLNEKDFESAFVEEIWKQDYKSILKALKHLNQIHPD